MIPSISNRRCRQPSCLCMAFASPFLSICPMSTCTAHYSDMHGNFRPYTSVQSCAAHVWGDAIHSGSVAVKDCLAEHLASEVILVWWLQIKSWLMAATDLTVGYPAPVSTSTAEPKPNSQGAAKAETEKLLKTVKPGHLIMTEKLSPRCPKMWFLNKICTMTPVSLPVWIGEISQGPEELYVINSYWDGEN